MLKNNLLMIIQFIFKTKEGPLILPKNYNSTLQGFFYKNMDRELSNFLHARGFYLGKRVFKLFVFSKIFGKFLKKENGKIYFSAMFRLYFASPKGDISIGVLREFILSRDNLFIGNTPVEVVGVNPIMVDGYENLLQVKTISPITVYKTPIGSRYYHYFSPYDDEFYNLLIENIKRKYILVYGRPPEGKIEIFPVKFGERDFKKIVFKGRLIKAWSGIFQIKAPKNVIKLILETGLGAKNSAGFGMVLPVGFKV